MHCLTEAGPLALILGTWRRGGGVGGVYVAEWGGEWGGV